MDTDFQGVFKLLNMIFIDNASRRFLRNFLVFFLFFSVIEMKAQLIENFSEETITNQIFRPVGIRFDPNGQAYVWEKRGLIHIIDSTGNYLDQPLLDLQEEVGGWGDHGMLGFALDPNFLENGYFYTMYVVDRHHLLYFGTSSYEPDSSITHNATIGRITRYQADINSNFTTTVSGSRKIILGESIDKGIPILIASHGVGSLVFGTDGTLLASTGESASFLSDDYGNDENSYFQLALDEGIIQEYENVGSFRAQLVNNLNGKILRIDPETGDGIPSNPYFDEANPRAPQSRVYALGLRNPFRFTIRPATGSHNPEDGQPGHLYIGDVGGSKWEELNVCDEPAMNFGYPLYEGILRKPAFWEMNLANPDATNPLFGDQCTQAFFDFQELIQQPKSDGNNIFLNGCDQEETIDPVLTYVHALPKITFANKLSYKPARAHVPFYNSEGLVDTMNIDDPDSSVPGEAFNGYSSVAGLFYEGDNFPEEFHGKYFHADYSWWIRTMDFDENNELHRVDRFHDHSDYVLDLAIHPKNGCLYYVNFVSKIQRICYGGNNPPVAIASYDKQYGSSPLTVEFTAENSYDPDGSSVSFDWNFGDGTSTAETNPIHTFEGEDNSPQAFEVLLTVTDSLGATDEKTFIISVNNTPPDVDISSFEDGDFYSINGYSIWPLRANVIDLEHDNVELDYSWTTLLKHNTHEHAEEPDHNPNTQTIIEPLGCDPDEEYWFQIQLEVRDPQGLVGRDTSELFPYCDIPFFELIHWQANATESTIELSWETGMEDDLNYFELQRITTQDGLNSLGIIASTGMNSQYQFTDDGPIMGYNNYRLKIYKTDGTFDFSRELRVLFPPLEEILVYPNPVTEVITFEVREVLSDMHLEIYNSAGALVHKGTYLERSFDVDLLNLAAGVYHYRLENGELRHWGKFIKVP